MARFRKWTVKNMDKKIFADILFLLERNTKN